MTPSVSQVARLTRVKTAPVLLAPVVVGAALAADRGAVFSWAWFVVALLGSAALFAGAMALNDFYDERSGADGLGRLERTSIITGSGFIAAGTMTPAGVLVVAAVSWTVALAAGIALAVARDPAVLIFGIVGALLAHQSVAPPGRLAYRGLGLLAVAAAFGPLAVGGGYLVQAEQLSADAWWASLVPALLGVLVYHHADLLHWRGDRTAKKMTVAARLEIERALVLSGALIIAVYVILTLQVAFELYPWPALFALATAAPLAAAWARAARDPVPQHALQLLGTTLGATVATQVVLALALAL